MCVECVEDTREGTGDGSREGKLVAPPLPQAQQAKGQGGGPPDNQSDTPRTLDPQPPSQPWTALTTQVRRLESSGPVQWPPRLGSGSLQQGDRRRGTAKRRVTQSPCPPRPSPAVWGGGAVAPLTWGLQPPVRMRWVHLKSNSRSRPRANRRQVEPIDANNPCAGSTQPPSPQRAQGPLTEPSSCSSCNTPPVR